jgi:putative transposase
MDYRKRRSRRKSINTPNEPHELTFTVYRRYQFLQTERVCNWLAESINEARVTCDFCLWAFVFMPDHVHLVICPGDHPDMSRILKTIKEPVSKRAMRYLEENAPQWIPRLTRRRGAKTERLFWQSGGGFDRNVTDAKTLAATIHYIHQNPLRKNLVERIEDWRWSSAIYYVSEGRQQAPIMLDPIPAEWAVHV